MSSRYGPPSRRIWTLRGGSQGRPGSTAIAASGDSGSWPAQPWTDPTQANHVTPVDLRDANDVALMVSIGAIVSTPSLVVMLDLYDDQGNLYGAQLTTGAITAAGQKIVAGGAHGQGANYLVLPDWGRVSWTCSGGSVTGVQIGLWTR
jgi:hypothetical protein